MDIIVVLPLSVCSWHCNIVRIIMFCIWSCACGVQPFFSALVSNDMKTLISSVIDIIDDEDRAFEFCNFTQL